MTEAGQDLAARVGAPKRLALPIHPDVPLWRPAGIEDLDRIWRLSSAIASSDHPNHLTTRDGLAAIFARQYFRPAHDSLLGFDSAGRVVASGLVLLPSLRRSVVRSTIVGGVDPERRGRGIGQRLLAWQVGRAKQQLAESGEELPGWVLAFADERAPRKRRLLQRAGFSLRRHFVSLERRLDTPISPVEPIGTVRIAHYREGLSSRIHLARDAAFSDHWGSAPMSTEAWDDFIGGSSFRAELSFVALAPASAGGASVVGFGLGSANEADWPHQGFRGSHIDMLGVVPGWRGRRVASAVLSAQLQASREEGMERVTLDVDADSTTGAYDLYRKWEFTPRYRKYAYTLEY
ncbi:GNAT family N-acetyltransferase [Leifsonia kafniensis]